MAIEIKDGTGSNFTARVTSENHLETDSITTSTQLHRTEEGDGYNLNTGLISLSSASESAVLYFKYTGTTEFVVTSIAVGIGDFAGTPTDPAVITLVRNPTAGTIVDNAATSGVMNQNRNFGSANTLSGLFYKGAEGYTFTDGDDIAILYQNQNGRLFANIDFVLTPSTSIGVKLEPNEATAGDVYVALIGYEE